MSATRHDPYLLSPDEVQEAPTTLGSSLKQIGPGLILTASIVGTGELIATTNLGATAGLALLWVVLLSCFIKVFVQVELGRFTISSGETTLAGFRKVPAVGLLLCWWWLGMMLCTQFQIAAMIGGVGHALYNVFPGFNEAVANVLTPAFADAGSYVVDRPAVPWGVVVTLITIVLLIRGRYSTVERWSIGLVGLFTLSTVVCMLLLPWASEPANPAPHNPLKPAEIWMAAFAMIGITGVGASELVSYPYWCLEKGYARHVGPQENSEAWTRRARGWMKVMQLDAWLSMIVYTLATIAFFVLGAVVLYAHTGGRGLPSSPGAMLDTLAKMYEGVLGPRGSMWFITIGGFVVLYSTLFAATAGNSRAAADFLRVNDLIPADPPEYRQRWIRHLCAIFPILALVLYLYIPNPVLLVKIGGISQALTLPLIAGVSIYLRLKHTDRRLVHFGWWDWCLWAALVMFGVAAAWGVLASL